MDDKQFKLDLRYLRMAHIWAENSYCKRRQVGCLVVKDKMIISDGYNGTPSGFENVCEDENNVTHPYVLHAEANAIIAAPREQMLGATLYLVGRDMSTGEIMRDANSCTMCKRMIINAGISQVIIRRDNDTYDTIDVADWVAHDDVLDGQTGY